ncbi:hypothetical protein M0R19_09045 [Candidatus Pacearchaeota archaeon]|nr:hypothetical protein [Candidatus Pacearchaeota archaeon]
MEKKKILNDIENSVDNNDVIKFSNIILNLSNNDIISLTYQDIKKICEWVKNFSFEEIPEFIQYLNRQGNTSFLDAKNGEMLEVNARIARFCLLCSIHEQSYDTNKLGYLRHNAAVSCNILADLGIESIENLNESIFLSRENQRLFSIFTNYHIHAITAECDARLSLAELGIDVEENLIKSINLCSETRKTIPLKNTYYAHLTLSEGNARIDLAHLGKDSVENLIKAVNLFEEARSIFKPSSFYYSLASMNEGCTKKDLADLGIDAEKNLTESIKLYENECEAFHNYPQRFANLLLNKANARRQLAFLGLDVENNLNESVKHCQESQNLLSHTTINYANSLMTEVCTRLILTELGIEVSHNLNNAIELLKKARKIYLVGTPDYAGACLNEGSTRLLISEYEKDKNKENLEKALDLNLEARSIFLVNTIDYAHASANVAISKQYLADFGINVESNINEAIELYEQVRKIFQKGTPDFASSSLNEGTAKQFLADQDIEPEKNLNEAIILFNDALDTFQPNTSNYAHAVMNKGNAVQRLAEIGVNSQINTENALVLFSDSLNTFLICQDGAGYGKALKNTIRACIIGYHITGNQKSLISAKEILKNVKFKIGTRDILFSHELEYLVHELRANLYEYGTPVQLDLAAREYSEAYKISNANYHNFMDQFCRAKDGKIRFCDFVEHWNFYEKIGLMWEYYNYAEFECHIEKALKSTIYEEEELLAAIKTLELTRDKTDSFLLKERFDAYLALVNAVYLSIIEKNFIDAKKSLQKGCQIFRKYNDNNGVDMCELFHEAISSENDPDCWRAAMVKCKPLTNNLATLIFQFANKKELETRKPIVSMYMINNKTSTTNIKILHDNSVNIGEGNVISGDAAIGRDARIEK